MRVLLVEDDKGVASFIRKSLESEHYAVDVTWDGENAMSLVAKTSFDLIILDLGLPGVDGLEVLKHIRSRKPSPPVLILSGRARVEDRVKGLDLGADDYLAKPFSFDELSARVRALLRRSADAAEIVLRVEDLELDRAERVVRRAGRRIDLTPREFALLECLMRNAGRCVTRAMIVAHVWEFTLHSTTNVIDVYINYLRNKVDRHFEHKLIHTIRNAGYILGAEEAAAREASNHLGSGPGEGKNHPAPRVGFLSRSLPWLTKSTPSRERQPCPSRL